MANTNHRDLTGVALHEPKGVSSATDGQTYVADGSGSGSWTASGNPAGTVIMYATDAVPSGYLECNGASISTTTYADLHAVISYEYGGSGANFNIPDLRGTFIRGYDNSAGIDPDAGSRTSRGDVAATLGDQVGTKQATALIAHTHTYNKVTNIGNEQGQSGDHSGTTQQSSAASGAHSVTSSTESRPVNITMMYCIKT